MEAINGGHTMHQAGEGCTLQINEFAYYKVPSFVDYLRSGWGLSMANAIDYTASNGNPKERNSLHYLGKHNAYEKALLNVG